MSTPLKSVGWNAIATRKLERLVGANMTNMAFLGKLNISQAVCSLEETRMIVPSAGIAMGDFPQTSGASLVHQICTRIHQPGCRL